jgi:hypothetical protein
MREVNSPTGIRYRVHETPADLAVLTDQVAGQQRIWLDTEFRYPGQSANRLDRAFTAPSVGPG